MLHRTKISTVFVIIPAYNENVVLRTVIEELIALHMNIIVVDDGSAEHLYSLLNQLPVYVLRHRINLGQGAAIQTGIEFALSKKADIIVTFDADGQHTAGDIEKMVNKISEGSADIVFGSRFMKGAKHNMPASRRFLLQMARYLNYFFTGILLTDAHNGLRAMNRKTASLLKLKENRMAHATELVLKVKKNKLWYTEMPVSIQYTQYSLAKGQSAKNSFRILLDLLLNKLFK
jgi:glycosyltransferase involved in cell wall biosynthesis